jgi:hypothetical protein
VTALALNTESLSSTLAFTYPNASR